MSEKLYVRIADAKPVKGGKTLRMAMVSEIVDSYRTIIPPNGCVTPLSSVGVDLMHSRVATECQLIDVGIGQVEVPTNKVGEDGQVVTEFIEARVVDVFVPENAREWTKENEHKRVEEVPSLYDDVKNWPNNRYRWGSVDFTPIEIAEIYDADGNKIREEYPKYRVNFFSLLKTKPGQDTSYVVSIRSLDQNNMSEAKPAKSDNKIQKDKRSTQTSEEYQELFIGSVVKNKQGQLGIVTNWEGSEAEKNSQYEITLLDGNRAVVPTASDNKETDWKRIGTEEVLLEIARNLNDKISPKKDQTCLQDLNHQQINSEEHKLPELLKRQLEEEIVKNDVLESKNRKLVDTINRLRNSPKAVIETEGNPVTDLEVQGVQPKSAQRRKLEEAREEILNQIDNPYYNNYASIEN